MPVQSKSLPDPILAHDLERAVIHKAELFSPGCQQGAGSGGMDRSVNPADVELRDNVAPFIN